MDPRVVCIGGTVLDRKLRLKAEAVLATSNPASAVTGPGGVARNVAERLARLGIRTALVSAVGEDDAGRRLLAELADLGVDVTGVRRCDGLPTGEYVAVLHPSGELLVAAAVLDVMTRLTWDDVARGWPDGQGDRVFAEANLEPAVLAATVARAHRTGTALAVDAVSVSKAARLPADLHGVDVLFCNLDEARALIGSDSISAGEAARALRARGAASIVVTLGADGALVLDPPADGQHVPGIPVRVRDVTGAGDTLIAATLAAARDGASLLDAVRAGVAAASAAIG